MDAGSWLESDKADAIVCTDAHNSNGIGALRKLNASVMNEDLPYTALNPPLDPFDEENGYNPDGHSVFSEHFIRKYTDAQSERMKGLINKALKIREDIQEGKRDPNDDAVIIYRDDARLSDFSLSVHGSTQNPAQLLKNDGTIEAGDIVQSVRLPNLGRKERDYTRVITFNVTSFLSANAIRSTNSLDDIDWCSSNNSTICAVREISVPMLIAAAQGHYFLRDGEEIYENAGINVGNYDKEYIVIAGMAHGLYGCADCPGGPYDNAEKNLWDYVTNWVNARF